MKKLIILCLLSIAPITMILAQYASDTIFLTNGKYYICNVIDANEDYVQYEAVAIKSQVLNVVKNENYYQALPDVIYMKSGKEIACKIISETSNKVYYARNYPSSHVKSLHMGDGEIIYASEFGELSYTDNLDPSTAELFTSVQNDEPAVISKTITTTPATRYELQQDTPLNTATTDNYNSYTTADKEQQYSGEKQVNFMREQTTITFSLVGDIMPGDIYEKHNIPANNGSALFKDATPIFKSADFTLGNLETTLANSGTPRNINRDYMFLTPTVFGKTLKDAGIDFLSIANNHTLDFGTEGVASTIKTLKENNIYCTGLRKQAPFVLVNIKGIKVAICAFGFNFYCNPINKYNEVKRIIDLASQNADIVVVSFHGGAEGKEYRDLPYDKEFFLGENRGDLREFAHFCIDNGADIVYGHGPHVVRAVELYNNRFIAYSLGNFCTPYGVSILGINGYAPIVNVTVDANGKFENGKIYSLRQKRGIGPRLDDKQCALNEIRMLSDNNISNGAINITSTGHIIVTPVYNNAVEESEEFYDENE